MRLIGKNVKLIGITTVMLLLILDSQGALIGAQDGVQICIKSLIPSLFPFFVVGGYFTSLFAAEDMSIFNPLLRFCKVPNGADSILIVGGLGGYPVGAKAISDYYRDGYLDRDNARRLLGFCNNAGPAFVFGIAGNYFCTKYVPWILWGILLLSAILTGYVLPKPAYCNKIPRQNRKISFSNAFQSSINAMASVCAWVVLFRVLLSIMDRWILWPLPNTLQIVLTGLLELSNGCISLSAVVNDGLRFMLAAGFLSFGGLCVYLQTASVAGTLGTGYYFPGKVLQCLFSIVLSGLTQYILFPYGNRVSLPVIFVPTLLLILVIVALKIRDMKKTVAFPNKVMYNTEKIASE